MSVDIIAYEEKKISHSQNCIEASIQKLQIAKYQEDILKFCEKQHEIEDKESTSIWISSQKKNTTSDFSMGKKE